MFIFLIYYHNWGNISTIYIYNKTSIKRNILIIKQNTVKPVKLTTFIRLPLAYVDHISVEPAKPCIVCIYDHLRNFSTFICWIPVYVSHAKWNQATVYTCLY